MVPFLPGLRHDALTGLIAPKAIKDARCQRGALEGNSSANQQALELLKEGDFFFGQTVHRTVPC